MVNHSSFIPASGHDMERDTTDDTTMEDEYEMQRLDSLPPALRQLAATHAQDQFDAVPSYFDRFKKGA